VEAAKGRAPRRGRPRQRLTDRTDVPNMERRINHPQDVLKWPGVRAQVLEVDTERRRLRLGMNSLSHQRRRIHREHKDGDVVTAA